MTVDRTFIDMDRTTLDEAEVLTEIRRRLAGQEWLFEAMLMSRDGSVIWLTKPPARRRRPGCPRGLPAAFALSLHPMLSGGGQHDQAFVKAAHDAGPFAAR